MLLQKEYWESDFKGIPAETSVIFKKYLLNLKVQNKSKTTIIKYHVLLERFLSEWNALDELTEENVLLWMDRSFQDKSLKSEEYMFLSLSSFFDFCSEEKYMQLKFNEGV